MTGPLPHRGEARRGERVFRTATWYRVVSLLAMVALASAGAFYIINGTAMWQRGGGIMLAVFGIAGFIDVLLSRIVLTHDDLQVISLVRKRVYPRAEFESAKVDGGAVCLKKRGGGWLVLPDTGANALSVRNTIDAWIKRGS